jgi:hypothetical protein
MRGDKVRVLVSFSYRGQALSVATLRCAIGNWGVLFDEIAYATKNIGPIPASSSFVAYTAYADVDTTPIAAGVDYDLECKIQEYTSQTLARQANCIDVLGAPEFQDFKITDYSKA